MATRNQPQLQQNGSKSASATNGANGDAPHWTFLTNHAHVLILLYSEPDLVLREVAAKVGITERAVQRIVQELEQGGVLKRERVGRRNSYRISGNEHLRHPVESHRTIDDLLSWVAERDHSKKTTRRNGARGAK